MGEYDGATPEQSATYRYSALVSKFCKMPAKKSNKVGNLSNNMTPGKILL
jgi:hypothetical protein